jgi:TetR/AcrR family transcriptional repressor of nem operon
MPWQPGHKERTRQRILETAAAAFRAHGIAGVGIADIMQRAGLTHGGFYAHFESKEALLAEEVQRVGGAPKIPAECRPDEKLAAITEAYLSSRHREHPESGCLIPTLGCELARTGGAPKRSFDAHIRARLDRLASYAPASGAAARRRQATGALAAMVGGMILARGVEGSDAGDQILADVRAFLADALAPRHPRRAPRSKP